MVHSDRTVVVLLHKQFSSWLMTLCDSVCITMNYTYLIWTNLKLWHISAICSPSSSLHLSNFYWLSFTEWRIKTNLELMTKYKSQDIVTVIKIQRLEWIGHVIRINETRSVKKIFEGKLRNISIISSPSMLNNLCRWHIAEICYIMGLLNARKIAIIRNSCYSHICIQAVYQVQNQMSNFTDLPL